jgi:hypothetical protein
MRCSRLPAPGAIYLHHPCSRLFQRGELNSYVDIGVGSVFFAKTLQNRIDLNVRVLDSDSQSIDFCYQAGI